MAPSESVHAPGGDDADLPELHVDNDRDANLPEVWNQDAGKQVSYPNEKEHHAALRPDGAEEAVRSRDKKIWGLRRRPFYILLAAAVLVAVGAVLGGALGGTLSHRSSKGEAESNAAQSANDSPTDTSPPLSLSATPSTNTSPTDTSPPSSSSATPSVVTWKAGFKFPSLALTGTGGGNESARHSYLFSLQGSDNSIRCHTKRSASWEEIDMTNSSAFDSELPTVMSPLAAVAWKNDSDDALRLYYISVRSNIVEIQGRCDVDMVCDWSSHVLSPQHNEASLNSRLTAIAWSSSLTDDDGSIDQILLYYVNHNNSLVQRPYSGSWLDMADVGISVYEGSGLAATEDTYNLYGGSVRIRIFFHDLDGVTMQVVNSSTLFSTSDIEKGQRLPVGGRGDIAACLYNSSYVTSVDLVLKVSEFQIDLDRTVGKWEQLADGGSDWLLVTDSFWDKPDDPGGAIACQGWAEKEYLSGRKYHVVYAVNGTLMEYLWQDAENWTRTAIFS